MDLGEGPGPPPPPPLFLVKKEEMTEGKMADRASKSRLGPPPPPLAQGLDPPLIVAYILQVYEFIYYLHYENYGKCHAE